MQMIKYDIDNLVGDIDFESGHLVEVSRNVLLTKREIEVLDRYKINYKNCVSLKEVMFLIEKIIDDMDIVDEELEIISDSISERDYYQNTNK